jgi:hypothetical protein
MIFIQMLGNRLLLDIKIILKVYINIFNDEVSKSISTAKKQADFINLTFKVNVIVE